MKRIATATLFVLGLAATAAQAQSQTLQRINSKYGDLRAYGPPFDFTVQDVLSVTPVSADTLRAALRLSNGAMISVDFWSPAVPPVFSTRQYLHPVPALLMTRALMSIQANPSAYARPFTLGKIWKSSYSSVYEAYWKSELHVTLSARALPPLGGTYAGNLTEVHLAASGLATADRTNPPAATGQTLTWGRIVLQNDSGHVNNLYFYSDQNPAPSLTPITTANASNLAVFLFSGAMYAQFSSLVKDPLTNERIIINDSHFAGM